MAGDGGRQNGSVKDQLYADASRFSFVQAVRLLEQIARADGIEHSGPAEDVSPRHELVIFQHAVRFDFPETDVEELIEQTGAPPKMTVNVLGLAGSGGPLPYHLSELVLERALRGDRNARDFLDIFNHRLISLLYRARKKYRPQLDPRGPSHGRVATVLFSLLGLGTRHLQKRMGIDDRMLLAYAGLIADQRRSAAGLERIVQHCFGVPAKVVPFQGRWNDLHESDQTCIGVTGRNQLLGRTAVVGRRVWDQAACFEVRLGPLSPSQFRSFLPNVVTPRFCSVHALGDAYRALVAVVRFYTREELGFTIRLVLNRNRVPRLRLRRPGPLNRRLNRAHLGLTSWLKSRAPEADVPDDERVTFVGRR
jgi:type VI secretion system protein ImpH